MIAVRSFVLALAVALLAACASVPPMPETTYYRLPPPQPSTILAEPVVDRPVVVEVFRADGLYSGQSLVYALDHDASRLRAYHYQLWLDPPPRLLQRRLIAALRAAGISRVVTDQLPTRMEAMRVEGRIERLERVRNVDGTGWEVIVALVLRAEPSSNGRPWVIGEYHQRIAAGGDQVNDSVRAFGLALDRIGDQFVADLAQHAADVEAGHDDIRVRRSGDE